MPFEPVGHWDHVVERGNVLVRNVAVLIGSVALASAIVSCTSKPTPDVAPSSAPTIYLAERVVTMDPDRPRADAVAVAGGRILGVGSRAELLDLAGDTAIVDRRFADHVIVPGLIDQHLHPLLAALTFVTKIVSIETWALPTGTFPAARNQAEYVERLRAIEAALEEPNAPLFTWGYHHYFHGKVDRALLDEISATRPIAVWHRSVHETILNSRAIELLGITDAAIDALPEAVRAQIDLGAGHFVERGNLEFLMPRLLPALAPPEALVGGLVATAAYMHANGVTVSAEPGGAASYQPLVESVLGDADTPLRFYFIPDGRVHANAGHLDDVVERTEATLARETARTAPLHKQVKLFSDGAMFSQLMQMQDGYTDGHHGEWLMEPETFARAFRAFWEADYQIHIHTNGDGGLELVLDTLEANLARRPRNDHRTTIVHFGFSTAEQVERIAALGAIVSANSYYTIALADRYGEIGIGPERADAMVRLGDVESAGVSFSFHSDMPMAPSDPLFLVWSAVNRQTPSGRVAGPDQRVSVEAAMRAVTTDAAYSLRLEDEIGSITPGKRANFTILDSDPFEVDPMAIRDIGVWGTVLEGRIQPVATR